MGLCHYRFPFGPWQHFGNNGWLACAGRPGGCSGAGGRHQLLRHEWCERPPAAVCTAWGAGVPAVTTAGCQSLQGASVSPSLPVNRFILFYFGSEKKKLHFRLSLVLCSSIILSCHESTTTIWIAVFTLVKLCIVHCSGLKGGLDYLLYQEHCCPLVTVPLARQDSSSHFDAYEEYGTKNMR